MKTPTKKKILKTEKIPPEAKEEPKILQHSKYEEEPIIKEKSKYDEDEEAAIKSDEE